MGDIADDIGDPRLSKLMLGRPYDIETGITCKRIDGSMYRVNKSEHLSEAQIKLSAFAFSLAHLSPKEQSISLQIVKAFLITYTVISLQKNIWSIWGRRGLHVNDYFTDRYCFGCEKIKPRNSSADCYIFPLLWSIYSFVSFLLLPSYLIPQPPFFNTPICSLFPPSLRGPVSPRYGQVAPYKENKKKCFLLSGSFGLFGYLFKKL